MIWHSRWLGALVALVCTSNAEAQVISARELSEITRFVNAYNAPVSCSPDQSTCVFVTRKNDVARRETIFTLYAFERSQALRALRDANAQKPRLTPVVSYSTPRIRGNELEGIDHISWVDDQNVAYVARNVDTNDISQVFVLNVITRESRQMTYHPLDVYTFALSRDRSVVVYGAQIDDAPHRPNEPFRPRDVWETQSSRHRGRASFRTEFFALHTGANGPRRIENCVSRAGTVVSIADSGRYAAIPCIPHTVSPDWRSYAANDRLYASAPPIETVTDPRMLEANPAADHFSQHARVTIVDLGTMATDVLIDAPAMANTRTRFSSDDRYVTIGPIYPTVNACTSANECHRANDGLIPSSEQLRTIVAEIQSRRVLALLPRGWQVSKWEGASEFFATLGTGASVATRHYMLREASLHVVQETNASVEPSFEQTRERTRLPELEITDATGWRALTTFNENLRNAEFGETEEISWTSKEGTALTAQLTFPPNADHSVRRPVLIALYGNGTIDDWQEVSSRGVVVAYPQCRSAAGRPNTWEERAPQNIYRQCVESLIDELDRRGLVRRDRVGLSGLSNLGAKAMEIVTFSDYPFAAATILDSFSTSPQGYAASYGNGSGMGQFDTPYPLKSFDDSLIGAPFWDEGIAQWLERSSFFNLARVRTPLWMQFNGYDTGGGDAYWGYYAIMRRMQQPVEFTIVPDETHAPTSAYGLYFHRESLADWYDFWLNDHEDADPAKAEQYSRWRQYRSERDELARIPRPPVYSWTRAPVVVTH